MKKSIYYSPFTRQKNVIIDEINTANDASFIIFESSVSGNYKVVVRRWNGAEKGKYQIVLDYIKNTDTSRIHQIDELLSHFYFPDQPGAAILIEKSGKPLYKKCFGLADLSNSIPNTDSTVFDIASISKQIVAYSIAMLSKEDKLKLRHSIRVFIPEFPEYGDDISILQLVLHLSGIKDYNPILALSGYLEDEGDNITSERIFNSIIQFEETFFEPGSDYRYSNSGYYLLTEIIERVTGMSYAKWVKENIFTPLEMTDSYIYENDKKRNTNVSKSYKKNGVL